MAEIVEKDQNEQINKRLQEEVTIGSTEEPTIELYPTTPTLEELKEHSKIIEQIREASEPKVKKTRKRGNVAVQGGKADGKAIIKQLHDQIEKNNRLIGCIGFINTTVVFTDLPPDLEKAERDTLLAYTKEVEAVQSKYIKQIQEL